IFKTVLTEHFPHRIHDARSIGKPLQFLDELKRATAHFHETPVHRTLQRARHNSLVTWRRPMISENSIAVSASASQMSRSRTQSNGSEAPNCLSMTRHSEQNCELLCD